MLRNVFSNIIYNYYLYTHFWFCFRLIYISIFIIRFILNNKLFVDVILYFSNLIRSSILVVDKQHIKISFYYTYLSRSAAFQTALAGDAGRPAQRLSRGIRSALVLERVVPASGQFDRWAPERFRIQRLNGGVLRRLHCIRLFHHVEFL